MSDRDDLIRSLGTITLEAGWVDVCGDLGDLLDGLVKAGWRAPVPDREHVWAKFPDEFGPNGWLRCARCQLSYSKWHGDADCP